MFILRWYKWHIHAGSWSLVNCWREAHTRHYIRCSWILMNAAVGLMGGLGLDGDRCIRVIPRHLPSSLFTSVYVIFESLHCGKINSSGARFSMAHIFMIQIPVELEIRNKFLPLNISLDPLLSVHHQEMFRPEPHLDHLAAPRCMVVSVHHHPFGVPGNNTFENSFSKFLPAIFHNFSVNKAWHCHS